MIHPSYVDLMEVVNKNVEEGETPVINSRYSIVMATAKRARQIVDGDEPLVKVSRGEKPLSIAVDELNQAEIRILAEDEEEEEYPVLTESAESAETEENGEAEDAAEQSGEEVSAESAVFAEAEDAVDAASEEEAAESEGAAEEPAEEISETTGTEAEKDSGEVENA